MYYLLFPSKKFSTKFFGKHNSPQCKSSERFFFLPSPYPFRAFVGEWLFIIEHFSACKVIIQRNRGRLIVLLCTKADLKKQQICFNTNAITFNEVKHYKFIKSSCSLSPACWKVLKDQYNRTGRPSIRPANGWFKMFFIPQQGYTVQH